ncbi:GNAT family N-acetyltransferase [Pararhodobacter marinus]|uniref:GNAT family N-acetyltransferase n=1 Tax=Pararhodobacter marinus TaxID=2184063 RepID=UPI003510E8B2
MSAALFEALEASWPPASSASAGPFRRRDGAGGGTRTSATVLDGAFSEAALDALGPDPLFQIRPGVTEGQKALDQALEARGYRIVDPTVLMTAPIETIAEKPRPITLPVIWPPLAIHRRIWETAQVGPERIAVMYRAADPKTAAIARIRDKPAGVGFVSVHEGIAMLHALYVEPPFRREGVGRDMVRGLAWWAQQNGAQTFALAVVAANTGARALYTALGMSEVAAYHYRETTP